jgi:PBSX family phage terminase large subunit
MGILMKLKGNSGKIKKAAFTFLPFSKKQKQILTWWIEGMDEKSGRPISPHSSKEVLVCDGAVRSGKTVIMSSSFIFWAMNTFNGKKFGMAGKTIGSFRRNVLLTLKIILILRGYRVRDHRGESFFTVTRGEIENTFYIFGGKDERSQDLVQGFTSAGFFFDEVALMPESFVAQAVARCSEEGRKLWFNCNPDGPFHWFKLEWIDKIEEKNGLHLHFLLDDNPSLSKATKGFYHKMFSGVFFQRYILGLWVMAEGIIYSMFSQSMIVKRVPQGVVINKKWIGIDYGQSNATVFILVGLGSDSKLYILDEYYHSGRDSQIQKSPSKYSKDYFKWKIKNGVEGIPIRVDKTYIDPSAKGFMLQLFEDGERGVWQANNEVVKGIELLSSIMDMDMFRILRHCTNTISELSAYRWDPKAQERGEDKPIKQHDHALDAIRYVTNGTRMLWQRLINAELKKVA